ncbi:hypothetical protein Tco_1375014, partial [Tanacetum coccineum]
KLKCVCHWADPFKDLKWSNIPEVKLSLLSESDETFSSLQALSNLHYLFSVWFHGLSLVPSVGHLQLRPRRQENSTSVPKALYIDCQNLDVKRLSRSEMMDIGTLCRETISFIYNLVIVSILSVFLIGMKYVDLVRRSTMTQIVSCPLDVLEPGWMEYFDIWDSCMIKSLKPQKSGNQLWFLIHQVPSRRTSYALSIPRRHLLQHLPFHDGNESHNRNLRAILTNNVASCSTLSDQGYVEGFYDQ